MPSDSSSRFPIDPQIRHALVEIVREAYRAEQEGQSGPCKLLSLEDVADILGVSLRTVQRIVSRGEIGTVPAGAARRVHPHALDAYLRSGRGK